MNISKKKYILVNLPYIKKDINHFKRYANLALERFEFNYGQKNPGPAPGPVGSTRYFANYGQKSSTGFYRYYNCITLFVGSKKYYKMFKDLFKIIRKYSNTKEPLWIQCWLNMHKENELLKWHNHSESLFHGYVSIDPKKTETVFKSYTIKNKIGNVYIGPSEYNHKVVNKNSYNDERITIAFDVINEKNIKNIYKKYGEVDINASFIPIYV